MTPATGVAVEITQVSECVRQTSLNHLTVKFMLFVVVSSYKGV